MRSMYTAAENLLEDTLYDLIVDLTPSRDWDYLGTLLTFPTPADSLRLLVDQHRAAVNPPARGAKASQRF